MPAFKTDASFLEKISIGAIGTQRVFADLSDEGHMPIELERGSRSFKIWRSIKIKRIRVPDILCVKCGRRVESRGKTKFEVSMSHSYAEPERAWNSGLYDQDYVALVGVHKAGEAPVDWEADKNVSYVQVGEMDEVFREGLVKSTTPKGAQEGFESRLIWPSTIVSCDGTVVAVHGESIQIKRASDGRIVSYRLGTGVKPRVKKGELVVQDQIIASVITPHRSFKCDHIVAEEHFLKRLRSASVSERYAATKALRFLPTSVHILEALTKKLNDPDEHIYVRMEAAATLARADRDDGWNFIRERLQDNYPTHRLEAVIILAELDKPTSISLLQFVLSDPTQNAEVRAGAAWSLGELGKPSSIDSLVNAFGELDEVIRIEAARALARFAPTHSKDLIHRLGSASTTLRPGIAWALSRKGDFSINDLLESRKDVDSRQWISYVLGMRDSEEFINELEALKSQDQEVYFATTVLWKIVSSWVYELKEYG
jgi:HEAT repeats